MGGHEGQTDEYNRASVQGNRPKRKGATDQNEMVILILLGGRTACMGEGKNEKYCELRDRSGRQVTGAGQGALSDSAPTWQGRTGDRTGTQTEDKKKMFFSKNDG